MKQDIKNIITKLNLLSDEMTIWACRDGVAQAMGFIIYNHCGIDTLREAFKGVAKVYALRESDDLEGDPATIENEEVMVNFFGYFVTDSDLGWIFKNETYREVYTWDYDPWEV